MSLAIYPVFEQALETDEFDPALGAALAANIETLDEIAEEAELTPLSMLADSREAPEGVDGVAHEVLELLGPCTDWNDAGEGHIAVQALIDHLCETPTDSALLTDAHEVLTELEELARVLLAAEAEGIRFRLEIG